MAEGFSPSLLWLSITVTEEAVHNACAFAAADAVVLARGTIENVCAGSVSGPVVDDSNQSARKSSPVRAPACSPKGFPPGRGLLAAHGSGGSLPIRGSLAFQATAGSPEAESAQPRRRDELLWLFATPAWARGVGAAGSAREWSRRPLRSARIDHCR
jgi:hypothetical protein